MSRATLIFDVLGSWLYYGALIWMPLLLALVAIDWWKARSSRIRDREKRHAQRPQRRRRPSR